MPAQISSQAVFATVEPQSSNLVISHSEDARFHFPYPYKAILAVCSDLDETPDAETYFELMRFLNTTEETSMGPGVGLEVGNTFYFDMPAGHFSYWNTSEENREKIRTLIKSGHIDCLHSYGDLATTRAHAARALGELDKHDCRLKVWVDHAVAPTNFGTDVMHGHGDEPSHPAYHADLTLAYGIKYIWRGRVTSVIGQDRPPGFGGIFSIHHPLPSILTVCKEGAKQMLARCGSRKYRMHKTNRVLQSCTLRNGAQTSEFLRCNPHWGGVSCCDCGDKIGEVLTSDFLDQLVARRGACVLYTHFGKLGPGRRAFGLDSTNAFRLLSEYHRSGEILVTTTRRLLDLLADRQQRNLMLKPEPEAEDSRSQRLHDLNIAASAVGTDRVQFTRSEKSCLSGSEKHGRAVVPWRPLEYPSL